MFRFSDPLFFLLFLLPPLLLWLGRRQPSMAASSLERRDLPVPLSLRLARLLPALKYTALVLMILALARPQWGVRRTEVLTEGINIILAVDLSESMAALDFRLNGKTVNRLTAVKDVVERFIEKRNGDRIGMVVFGEAAYTQMPLTRDYSALVSMLDQLRIGMAGPSTAIGDAIGISLKRLEDIASRSNIIILLTDGQSNSGAVSPEAALEVAKTRKVKIYTVGVGSRGMALVPRAGVFGGYARLRADIDEKTLKHIARETGGLYFRADSLKTLDEIYATIDKMEKTDVRVRHFENFTDWYPWFLAPALAFLFLWTLLTHTRFLKIP
ncbi:MAG: magnesium chelatase [Desulfobacterales bacterium]|nr:MAG: magnesium chelatase [Desulfobacterales bacterium]